MSSGLVRLYEYFVPGYREGIVKAGVVPLLTSELLRKIREQFNVDPQDTLRRARRAIARGLTFEDLDRLIEHLDWAFQHPDAAIHDAVAKGTPVPRGFRFAGMEPGDSYHPAPDSTKFSDSDWTGFGLNCGASLLQGIAAGKTAFRWHTDYPSRFEYQLAPNANVALFSDFGTGLAHAWYIAKFIAAARPEAAIHLGGIYYTGKPAEVAAFYDAPLSPLVMERELWNLPGHHDYFSGGEPFFKGLDARRAGLLGGHPHRQEGSYFCLDSPAFRIIGIDGEYHSGARYTEASLVHWLAEKVAEARTAGRAVILLSANEPYAYDARHEEDLLHDVTASLPPDAIDLWFWGNTHHCAFFKPSDRLRPKFHGSCIGHGGYQYKRARHGASSGNLAPMLWTEIEPRFPEWTAVRQDMGNNGFCMMKLDDEQRTVTLDYIDWTNAPRATIALATVDRRLQVSSVKPHPRPQCR